MTTEDSRWIKKMKRCWIRCVIVLFVFISFDVMTFVWLKTDELNRNVTNAGLLKAISLYEKGGTWCVNFAKVTSFSWDKVYFFNPYRSSKEIDKTLGFLWLESRFTSISDNEGITLIAFVKNRAVIRYLEFYRGDADFTRLDNGRGYDTKGACFIKNEKGNWEGMNRQ